MLLHRKPDAQGDQIPPSRRLRLTVVALLLLLLLVPAAVLLVYPSISPDHLRSLIRSPAPFLYTPVEPPTNVSHLFFVLASSAKTWPARRNYTRLWWRAGSTRGAVWLDQETDTCSSSPPCRASSLTASSRPGARIAHAVKDAYKEASASGDIRWLVMGDDDTVFFVDNLVAVLGRYDHREMYYIGASSESVEQDEIHSYGMAFGGGGFAVSLPAAREVSRLMDGCLRRYAHLWGGDGRVQACLSELGVPLTHQSGFHQMDVRGSLYGLLAAHPVEPLLSLHHLDAVDTIFPGKTTQLEALSRLVAVSRIDPARILQQSICYDRQLNLSLSVSWGYAAELYPGVFAPHVLEEPLLTFRTWKTWKEGPFTFRTRHQSRDSCERPVVFFLKRAMSKKGGRRSVVEYRKQQPEVPEEGCKRPEYVAAAKVETVRVTAPKMNPNDWKRAPRRQCCEVRRSWWGNRMDVRIWRCKPGDSLTPP